MRVAGYAVITDPDGVQEFDTVKCPHCQFQTHIRKRAEAGELGGFCQLCMGYTCPRCAAKGGCTPFEKQLEQEEARGRLLRSMGL